MTIKKCMSLKFLLIRLRKKQLTNQQIIQSSIKNDSLKTILAKQEQNIDKDVDSIVDVNKLNLKYMFFQL